MDLDKLKRLIKNPIVILFLSMGIFLALIFPFFVNTSKHTPTQPTSTVTEPTKDINMQNLYETKTPSSTALTQEEQQYTNAKKQTFPNRDTTRTGTLVVITDPPGATIILDNSETNEEAATYTVPRNEITPIKLLRIPVGAYTATAQKNGYDMSQEDFTIEENKTTRIALKLPKIPSFDQQTGPGTSNGQ